MATTTASGKVIRGGKGWGKRVTNYLLSDEVLVKLARAMLGADYPTDPDGWRVCRLALGDRIVELVDLPNDTYVSIEVACVLERVRRMS